MWRVAFRQVLCALSIAAICSLVPSPTPSFSSLLSTVKLYRTKQRRKAGRGTGNEAKLSVQPHCQDQLCWHIEAQLCSIGEIRAYTVCLLLGLLVSALQEVRTPGVSVHTYSDIWQFTLLLLLLLSCGTAEWQAHQSQCSQKAEQFQHHLAFCRVSSVLELWEIYSFVIGKHAGGNG